jgi:hypothetical protein
MLSTEFAGLPKAGDSRRDARSKIRHIETLVPRRDEMPDDARTFDLVIPGGAAAKGLVSPYFAEYVAMRISRETGAQVEMYETSAPGEPHVNAIDTSKLDEIDYEQNRLNCLRDRGVAAQRIIGERIRDMAALAEDLEHAIDGVNHLIEAGIGPTVACMALEPVVVKAETAHFCVLVDRDSEDAMLAEYPAL